LLAYRAIIAPSFTLRLALSADGARLQEPKKLLLLTRLLVMPIFWHLPNTWHLEGHRVTRREPHIDLSRRERQIMDVVYRRGAATAAEITGDLPDPPTSTAVRTTLRILEDKGHLTHDRDGVRYVYRAMLDRDKARESVITHLVKTFFNGSAQQAMATMIDRSGPDLTDDELAHLASLIAKARKRQDSRK
jgi:predicted transcriptional regulator